MGPGPSNPYPEATAVWRIGCMGHTAHPANVTLLLAALAEVLGR